MGDLESNEIQRCILCGPNSGDYTLYAFKIDSNILKLGDFTS